MKSFQSISNRIFWMPLLCLLVLLTLSGCRSGANGGRGRAAGSEPAQAAPGNGPAVQRENPPGPPNDRPGAAQAADQPQRPGNGSGQANAQERRTPPDENNPLRLVLSEAQVNIALDAVEGGSNGELTINSALIDFIPGAMIFSASVTSARFSGDMTATLQPYVTSDGNLQFTLTDLTLNNQNVPSVLLEPIQTSVHDAVYAALQQTPDQLQLKSVQVTDTELIIEAYPKS